MKQYKYSARTREGKIVEGKIEAKNKVGVVEALQQKGMIVVSVNEDATSGFQKLNEINIGGVPMKDKVVFMRQMATMISAGLPLSQCLEILEAQATNPLFKRVLSNVSDNVQGGLSLAKSFRKEEEIFDDIVINLLEAGEESGHLEEVLLKLATQLEDQKRLNEKIKGAFTYPAVISVVVVAVVAIMMIFLVPAMEQIYSEFDAELPGVTRFIIAVSNFMLGYWWLLLIILITSVISIKYYYDTPSGKSKIHYLFLKIPVFGDLIIKIQLTNFNRVLGLLLSSGLSIVESLRLTAGALSNVHFKEAVLEAKTEVEKGVPMATPLARSDYFPLIVSQMVAVGEESGQIDMVLGKMAQYYHDEVEAMVANLTTLLEPFILIIVGIIVGVIALAVYLPMFTLIEVMA